MKKLTLQHCQDWVEKEHPRSKCLATEYTNANIKMLWECESLHQWEATLGNVKAGNWCPFCAKNARLTIQDCHQVALEKGLKCLSTTYKNNRTKLLWECVFGHQWLAPLNKVKNKDTKCPYCAGNRKHTISDCQAYAESKDGRCKSVVYVNNHTKLLWECKLGHLWEAIFHSIKDNKSWCPHCKSSKGEEIVFSILGSVFKTTSIVREYRGLDWLVNDKTGRKLPLDFYLPNFNLAIEYHGIQHFEPIDFSGRGREHANEQFEKAKYRDNVKKCLLRKHGVVFIEIPYTENNIHNRLTDELSKVELSEEESALLQKIKEIQA